MYSPEKKNPLIWALGRDHNIDFGIKNSSYCNFFFLPERGAFVLAKGRGETFITYQCDWFL